MMILLIQYMIEIHNLVIQIIQAKLIKILLNFLMVIPQVEVQQDMSIFRVD
jgi:hypothetical protein